MNIAVIYQSRTGHTKKVAKAIAHALHTEAWGIDEVKDLDCDLLILGGGVYAATLDKDMKKFLSGLTGTSAKRVALFGTSAGGRKPFGMMEKILRDKGLPIHPDFLFIPGAWAFLNRGRPNEDDCQKAEEWAKGLLEE